jgi:D-sedoheptulose 7-phosphate isomerase
VTHASSFFAQTADIAAQIDVEHVEALADNLAKIRANDGRLFILGVGGSAANASHAVNDFRKLCAIETYAPTDNVSELTARTNDDGWETVFFEWLKISRLNKNDGVLVFSVGGGNREKNVSVNLINALDHAKSIGASIMGIVGRDGGYTAQVADVSVIIPTVDDGLVTPHA